MNIAANEAGPSRSRRVWFKIFAGRLALVLFLFAAAGVAAAGETNYVCIVCGKGPLTGQIWLHPRGPICVDCEKIQEHCSICGLPVKDGDGHIKTADGRFICKFDKASAVLTLDQAKALFDQTRDDVVDLYGRTFALKDPDVTVNLFDVDYWSEKGQANSLHKFGFANTRKTAAGHCTHEVIMLSGRTREELLPVAAHEYTHLWINENRPDSHVIDGDTIEGICELTAYKLMVQKKLPAMQKRILENPYTNGKIKTLIAVEREGGTDYVLNWVKMERRKRLMTMQPWRPSPRRWSVPLPLSPPRCRYRLPSSSAGCSPSAKTVGRSSTAWRSRWAIRNRSSCATKPCWCVAMKSRMTPWCCS